MRRYLDLSSWIILFALLPFSVLAFLSQGAVPGDLFYPVKRGLENVILVASSVHPATKVAFRTDLTERRYKEAEQLLVLQGQTGALTEFVGHVQTVEEEILKLTSSEDKKEASEKLIAKIEEYETKLAVVQVQIEQQPVAEPQQPTSTPTQPTPAGQTPTPTPAGQSPLGGASPTPFQQTPTPAPTETPKSIIQIPFQQQTPTSAPIPLDTAKKEEVIREVEKTQDKLKEAKEKLKEIKETAEIQEKIREESKKQLERQKENRDREGRGRDGDDD